MLSRSVLRQTPRLLRRSAAALCTRPGFSRYESGLQFRDTHVPEDGRVAEDGDLLSLHYSGRLEDGTLFDTSLDDSLKGNQPEFEGIPSEALLGWDRGHPLQFTLSNQEARAHQSALGCTGCAALCAALCTSARSAPRSASRSALLYASLSAPLSLHRAPHRLNTVSTGHSRLGRGCARHARRRQARAIRLGYLARGLRSPTPTLALQDSH